MSHCRTADLLVRANGRNVSLPGERVSISAEIRATIIAAIATMVCVTPSLSALSAQQIDSVRIRGRTDSAVAVPARVQKPITRLTPPISPKRAFLYSLALPGFGQSRLDRGVSGALFSGVELGAIAMLRRSSADLRESRRYLGDSLPTTFVVSGSGLTPTNFGNNAYDADLIRTRRLHVEDWLAVLAFNHLLAGADAFVSAQLWDVPVKLAAIPRPDGALLVATIRW